MKLRLLTLVLAAAAFVTCGAAAQESAGTHKGTEHRITPDANQKKRARAAMIPDPNEHKRTHSITTDYTRHKKGSGSAVTTDASGKGNHEKTTHKGTGKR